MHQAKQSNPSTPTRLGKTVDPQPTTAEEKAFLQVTMCRYGELGRLMKAIVPIDDVEYIAVSHVWGDDAEWRHFTDVDGDVLASKEKLKFLEDRLASVVGRKWFWMDILCVDQRDDDARISVTQHIPTIFRRAQRTVVIRGAAGLRDCCVKAYELLPGGEVYDYVTVRTHHNKTHDGLRFDESVLTRLWPLQEIILSDCIQFVRCENVADKEITFTSPHGAMSISSANILNDLLSLAITWAFHADNPSGSSTPVVEFQKAFLNCAFVSRSPMTRHRSVPANAELLMHLDSTRRTSKPRDFILAIMPQYKFYTVPKEAKLMDFGKLFVDCCNQLGRVQLPSDGAMTPLLSFGSIKSSNIFTAMDNIPQPASLGDFVKLLGGGSPTLPLDMSARPVQVQEVVTSEVLGAISLIKENMDTTRQVWMSAIGEIGRELRNVARFDQEGHGDLGRNDTLFTMLRIILEILSAPDTQAPDEILVGLRRRPDFQEFLEPDSVVKLIRITALISCGLSYKAFPWSKTNLTTLTIPFDGPTVLVLAPNSVLGSDDAYEFLMFKSTKGLMRTTLEPEERWVLVARSKEEMTNDVMCLFPPDIERI